jgi:NAD-dependent dihydropyrimidine dehydrogenase PreA subunit
VYQVDIQKCDGCGTCVDTCPSAAIALVDEKAVINRDECAECGSCESECPNEAISDV